MALKDTASYTVDTGHRNIQDTGTNKCTGHRTGHRNIQDTTQINVQDTGQDTEIVSMDNNKQQTNTICDGSDLCIIQG